MSKLSSLRLLESYLEDLNSLIDESKRLEQLDVLEENDYEVRKTLQKITKFLERNDDGEDYDELVEQYKSIQDSITTIDASEYAYTRSNISNKKEVSHKKSVRFNDTLEFSQDSFEPFRDEEVDTDALFEGRSIDEESVESSTNQELFIQHQQQLLEQDTHLDSLAQSVRRQHGVATDIHEELGEQNILLDDLENQLDSGDRNLTRGQKRLKSFEKMTKENGQWLTIIVLIIVLVLLLVVLN